MLIGHREFAGDGALCTRQRGTAAFGGWGLLLVSQQETYLGGGGTESHQVLLVVLLGSHWDLTLAAIGEDPMDLILVCVYQAITIWANCQKAFRFELLDRLVR